MNYLSYRVTLHKLSSERNKIDNRYKKEYEKAIKEKDEEKRNEIRDDALMELNEIDDQILYLEHQYLRSEATKYLLPIPPVVTEDKGGLWEQSRHTGKYHLTNKGLAQLRVEVRNEKKERTELLAQRISIIIGLIGAIIGLVAVMKN